MPSLLKEKRQIHIGYKKILCSKIKGPEVKTICLRKQNLPAGKNGGKEPGT